MIRVILAFFYCIISSCVNILLHLEFTFHRKKSVAHIYAGLFLDFLRCHIDLYVCLSLS